MQPFYPGQVYFEKTALEYPLRKKTDFEMFSAEYPGNG